MVTGGVATQYVQPCSRNPPGLLDAAVEAVFEGPALNEIWASRRALLGGGAGTVVSQWRKAEAARLSGFFLKKNPPFKKLERALELRNRSNCGPVAQLVRAHP